MINKNPLQQADPSIFELVEAEKKRRQEGLEMIPSENHTSLAVLEALGSLLTDKYSEGYPHKRYYGGNEFIDKVEDLAIARAKEAFGVPFANVQPYSGTPANFAVYLATCKAGDTIMGQNLLDGGHLTHGWKTSFSGIFYNSVQYHVKPDGYIDLDEARKLAQEHKPKLIWVGASAYPREFPFKEMGEIADSVGAFLAADIAHISGLVLGGAHASPVPFVHIITTTTHKTLRGPRGALIMATEKGLQKDPELGAKLDKAVFPGLQGGPHNHQTAAIAVALGEAMKPEFKDYAHQVVKNAKALAQTLMDNGLKLVSSGTDNHLMLVDLTPLGIGVGVFAEKALDLAGITLNKNTIPSDPSSPFYPSGIRLGTPAITSRGMKEEEMKHIGKWIAEVVEEIKDVKLPEAKEERPAFVKEFSQKIAENQKVKEVKDKVRELCTKFPLPY
ncbi:MAG: serine hydroxymethyltransferase [Candidatus Wildermuthbacteria bacterium RIFCSPHIGHO2_02_FULL_48_16]|uniref:Serine hydroxymethyltransferase n=1 Tax=Candidatus Wildermuthbacteria bacterium RIFCSPHIGHO2_02_FULL_48_16 TaxID=1802453 RepID=A0A1G2R7U4_9BACT|nr:MAG: serine hydroxymethyltransferase [Candidatus Wildermuthbacteria bacterium RIFCSPHIGHO2_01_FULL_48_25]OHA68945.1 MAG: serine hydroxymethyltransferase [Candidatus Wildermuthbacteria bacterium RIFCSPHIGHO2_02_FULL_48_16]